MQDSLLCVFERVRGENFVYCVDNGTDMNG